MSLPEISRRCLSCGAAVRAGARFCPHCGKTVGDEVSPSQPGNTSAEGGAASNGDEAGATRGAANETSAPTTRDVESPREWVAPTREFSAFVEDLGLGNPESQEAARGASDESRPEEKAAGAGFNPAKTTPMARPSETAAASSAARAATDGVASGGAADAASGEAAPGAGVAAASETRGRVAGVREDAPARAERVRDGASAAFDDAPEDASVRFVVAAVVLFFVFLVFLFMSLKVLR